MTSNQKTPAGAALDLTDDHAYAAPMIIFGKKADDVMTAGATLPECSRALNEAGDAKVCSLTVAQG